jgi:pyruvate ferredoxin oxidoreductase delta subunit
MADKLLNWQELPSGDVLAAGTSEKFETGDWRLKRPVWYPERCIQCLLCWVSCPDSAITVKDGKMTGFDYRFCKGCGICALECPKKANAISMEPER